MSLQLAAYDDRRMFVAHGEAVKAGGEAARRAGGQSSYAVVPSVGGFYVTFRHPRTRELQGYLGNPPADDYAD